MIDYNFTEQEKDFHSTLFIQLQIRSHRNINLTVVCTSTGRDSTTYEIFDEDKKSMGERVFNCTFLPVTGRLNLELCEDLNILLEEYGEWINYANFFTLSKLAVGKCEGRYGNSISGGDCIITITNNC